MVQRDQSVSQQRLRGRLLKLGLGKDKIWKGQKEALKSDCEISANDTYVLLRLVFIVCLKSFCYREEN